MAIGAHGSFRGSIRDGVAMHALLVRSDHLCAEAVLLHYELLAVTRPASRGNVGMGDARFRIAGCKQFVWTSVAIDTAGGIAVALLNGLSVEAFVVHGLFVGVARSATNLL